MVRKKIPAKKALATNGNVPSYLAKVKSVASNDNFDSSDIVIPRIKLLQGMSDEVSEHPGAVAGEFFHTGADEPLGSTIRFVIAQRRKKYLLAAPLEDGQGILARADNARQWDRLGEWKVKIDKKTTVSWAINDLDVVRSGLTAWGTSDPDDENSPPAATLFYDYLVICPEHLDLGPCIITLARSQIAPAKKGLNTKIDLHRSNGRPLQSLEFTATATTEANSQGQSYFNWRFASAGFANEEMYNNALELSSLLSDANVRVADEVANDKLDDSADGDI